MKLFLGLCFVSVATATPAITADDIKNTLTTVLYNYHQYISTHPPSFEAANLPSFAVQAPGINLSIKGFEVYHFGNFDLSDISVDLKPNDLKVKVDVITTQIVIHSNVKVFGTLDGKEISNVGTIIFIVPNANLTINTELAYDDALVQFVNFVPQIKTQGNIQVLLLNNLGLDVDTAKLTERVIVAEVEEMMKQIASNESTGRLVQFVNQILSLFHISLDSLDYVVKKIGNVSAIMCLWNI